MRLPIPDDWDGRTYCYHLVCWPNSPQWDAILLGQVTAMARGWFWDEKTGSIVDTQTLVKGFLIDNTDSEGVIMGCGDLVAELARITAAVEGIETAQVAIEVNSASSATSTSELNANILAYAQSAAYATAWAQSIAIATASVEITNNVTITIGSVSPTIPPVAEQVEETGITTTPAPTDEYCDVATWIVDYAIAWFEALQDLSLGIGTFTVTGLYGMIGEVFTALTLRGVPIPITPATIVAILVGELYAWVLTNTFEANRDNGRALLAANRSNLICTIFAAAQAGGETAAIRSALKTYLESAGGPPPVISAIMPLFSLSVMAVLYYGSDLVEVPESEFDCGGCFPS